MEYKNIYEKLSVIQATINVKKGQKNSFGNYNYRSCEDILQALQPMVKELGIVILLSDEIKELLNGWIIVEATAKIVDCNSKEEVSVKAQAGIQERKGMDLSQTFGASSSYARKYALNGLLKLDDNKDADTDAFTKLIKKNEIEDKIEEVKVEIVEQKKASSGKEKKSKDFTDAEDLPFPEIVQETNQKESNYDEIMKLQDMVAKKCEQVNKKPLDCYAYYSKLWKEPDIFKFTPEQYQIIIERLDKTIAKRGNEDVK